MMVSVKCRFYLCLVLLLMVLKQAITAPAQLPDDKSTYDEIEKINKKTTGKYFEGDIIPTLFEKEIIDGKIQGTAKRDTRRLQAYLWRTRVIPYEIDPTYTQYESDVIKKALIVFESKTCLKFIPHSSNDSNWINFKKREGCSSSVGRLFMSGGGQTINLGNGCIIQATVLHEVMHAIGFWHEQSRPDRDQSVEIFWENIEPSMLHNFYKYSHLQADVLGVGYDYDSLMHYGNYAFSKNNKPTIQAIGQLRQQLGKSSTFSARDVIQINALYDCANKDVSIWSTWSGYSPCSSSCSKNRQRFCSHSDLTKCPTANQYGVEKESVTCTDAECYAPLDGHWGRWSSWGACHPECGEGQKNRTRTCDDPASKNGGKTCPGDSKSMADCFVKRCGLGDLDCEFDGEAGWCHWQNDAHNPSRFTWHRGKGRTPSQGTGPSQDHTTGNGYYLYTEASAPAQIGDKARILSKQIDVTDGICISFWYHMFGSTMGTLRMFTRSNTGIENEIWTKSQNQGDQWLSSNKTIVSETPFQVIFEVETGNFLSDIGLDDIFVKDRKCEKYAVEATCGVAMKSLGCFAESSNDRIFSKLLDTHRTRKPDHNYLIDWYNYPKSIEEILCHCAERAKKQGYKYFGLQYYAECWSAPGEINYKKYGAATKCIDSAYQECSTAKDQPCSGEDGANYVYKLL